MNNPDQGFSSASPAANIDWPELRFPPINLWVMAALPHAAARPAEHAARTHRKQRPVASHRGELALHHLMPGQAISRRNIRMQMQRLLAAR